ncbi:MAG: branched-chain amino acid aminotransferase, partial [candidate division NC10 bacterium]
MALICYVNGVFCAAEEARISAFDHGFLYGDGIFESLTAAHGRIFKLGEHLDRLERSARAL